jgi:hypothetical protein
MPRPEVIQVQFRPEEAALIKASADLLGISQSAYVRRLAMSKIVVPAWWARSFDGSPGMTVEAIRADGVHRMNHTHPNFILQLMYDTENGGGSYKVFNGDMSPLTFNELRNTFMFTELHKGRLVMAGSHMLWEIVRSFADDNLEGQIVWLLAADRRGDREPATKAGATEKGSCP